MSHAEPSKPRNFVEFVLYVLLALVTVTIGARGIWLYEEAQHKKPSSTQDQGHGSSSEQLQEHQKPAPNLSSVVYHAVQFLWLHGAHLHEPIPWELHVGRWLGVLWLSITGVLTYWQFFRQSISPTQPPHLVICGLGGWGMKLALEARQRGKDVVAIDKQKNANTESAREQGIEVIEGDALDPGILKRAKLDLSESLLVASEDDAANVAIARQVGSLITPGSRPNSPFICRLLVRDPKVLRQLEQRRGFEWGASAAEPHPDYRVLSFTFDLPDMTARKALRMYPLDFETIRAGDATRVHVVIVGFGPMGKALALQAARIGHYANYDLSRKIRITVVDTNATAQMAKLKGQYSTRLGEYCDLNGHDLNHSSSDFADQFEQFLPPCGPDELQTVILCVETSGADEELAKTQKNDRNRQLCGELMNLTNQNRRQWLIYQNTHNGYDDWLRTNAIDRSWRLHPFGMIEDLNLWSVLLHEGDKIASAIHENYVKHHSGSSWEALPEHFKESNRHAADHVRIKLRAIDCRIEPRPSGEQPVVSFEDDELMLMAKMEHERWCAERILDGWEYGKKTMKDQKIHQDLVQWKDLPTGEEKKDFEQIIALPEILRAVDQGIYRIRRNRP